MSRPARQNSKTSPGSPSKKKRSSSRSPSSKRKQKKFLDEINRGCDDETMELYCSSVAYTKRANKKLNLLYKMGNEPERAGFVTGLIDYLAETGLAHHTTPWVNGVNVDLFKLYQIIQRHGGFVEAQKSISWHAMALYTGLPQPLQHHLRWLKKTYVKLVLAYEARSDRGGANVESLVEADRVLSRTPEYRELNHYEDTVTKNIELPRKRPPSPPRNEFGHMECDVCRAEKGPDGTAPSFARYFGLVRHKHQFHGVAPPKDHFRFTCQEEGCNEKFKQVDQMTDHLREFHRMAEFAVKEEIFYSRRDYYNWKLLKMEATCTAFAKRPAYPTAEGHLVSSNICFHNRPCGKKAYIPRKESKKQLVEWIDCPAFVKAIEIRDKDMAGRAGSYPIKVEYCLTHYGHDPANDARLVKSRLDRLKRYPETPDFNLIPSKAVASTEEIAEAVSSIDDGSEPNQNSATDPNVVDLGGFRPSEPVNVDPVTGRLKDRSVEINRLHAGIILRVNELSKSRAPDVLALLELLHQQTGVVLEAAAASELELDAGIRRTLKRTRKPNKPKLPVPKPKPKVKPVVTNWKPKSTGNLVKPIFAKISVAGSAAPDKPNC